MQPYPPVINTRTSFTPPHFSRDRRADGPPPSPVGDSMARAAGTRAPSADPSSIVNRDVSEFAERLYCFYAVTACRNGFERTRRMKKKGILNPAICSLIAELGHGDEMMIVDAGFPLPSDSQVIDLSLTPGIPRFLDVLRAVAAELVIDSIIVAQEISDFNEKLLEEMTRIVGDEVDIEEVPNHELREQAGEVKGIIRSGEFTPYANVRIVCGSAF